MEPLLYIVEGEASITQPLLRGFSTDLVVPRVDILRAKIASKRERAQLAVTAPMSIERTEDAYWDVVHALYHLRLQVALAASAPRISSRSRTARSRRACCRRRT